MDRQYLYQDPQLTYPIQDLSLPFSDYITQCQELIHYHRFDLAQHANIIQLNSPFEFKPQTKARCGALLVHGLLDSGFVMRDIAQKLSDQGIWCRGLLLPGHGVVPGALLSTTAQEWQQAIGYGVESFKKEVDHLFLVGYSLGAALCIQHVLDTHDPHISGLISLAPALKIRSSMAFISRWHNTFGKLSERLRWAVLREEIDYVKYCSFPFNAVYQCYALMEQLRKRLENQPLNVPHWAVTSLNDQTISSQAVIHSFLKQPGAQNQLVIYANQALKLNDPRVIIRPARYGNSILDISHIAIPNSPANPHYGVQGDYPLASKQVSHCYYDEASTLQSTLATLKRQLKLTDTARARLTYNPDFEGMVGLMVEFIKQIV